VRSRPENPLMWFCSDGHFRVLFPQEGEIVMPPHGPRHHKSSQSDYSRVADVDLF
jgi:hypothetical protein